MNNREAMQKAFEGQKFKVFSPFKCDISKNEDGNYVDDETIFAFAWFCRGIASQAQQESKPVAWGYAWQCKSMGDWRIEKLGEGCIPPKDTLALYVIPPAPEGGDK